MKRCRAAKNQQWLYSNSMIDDEKDLWDTHWCACAKHLKDLLKLTNKHSFSRKDTLTSYQEQARTANSNIGLCNRCTIGQIGLGLCTTLRKRGCCERHPDRAWTSHRWRAGSAFRLDFRMRHVTFFYGQPALRSRHCLKGDQCWSRSPKSWASKSRWCLNLRERNSRVWRWNFGSRVEPRAAKRTSASTTLIKMQVLPNILVFRIPESIKMSSLHGFTDPNAGDSRYRIELENVTKGDWRDFEKGSGLSCLEKNDSNSSDKVVAAPHK